MRTARQQEARSIQAQGLKQAQIIRAEADAEAAATYAQAFNQDPDFYDFYRAMQSYEASFLSAGTAENPRGRTSIILSPDNRISAAVPGTALGRGKSERSHSNPVQQPHLGVRQI